MPTFQVPFINKGQPFEFSNERLTPAAIQAGLVSKAHTLKAMTTGLDNVPAEVRKDLLEEARLAATIAESSAALFEALVAVDPQLRDVGPVETLRRLTSQQFKDLVNALRPPAPAGAAPPLAMPPSPPASAT